ncbi:MAG: TlpA family protein disulfide reductase [Thermomicrobiales bacterium]
MATTMTAGKPLPEMTLPSLDGKTRDLAGFRGKRLLLFFWGYW